MKKTLTQGQKDRYQNAFVLFCCLVVSLLLQIFKFRIFPGKYFFDANAVQNYMRMGIAFNPGNSYYNAALFLKWMDNWFPMDSQLTGGLVLWSLLILPCGWIVIRYLKATWEHYLLVSSYAVMLPVFVWNTHKEVLQFVFFLLLAGIAYSIKEENIVVDGMIISFLFLWGIIFRSYYVIIATGTAFFMVMARLQWGKYTNKEKRQIVISVICLAFIMLLLMSLFIPQAVTTLFNGRMGVNSERGDDPNANTIILDWIENPHQQLSVYLLNYIIAAVRMMLPIELLFKGVQYIPFVAFQFFWTVLLGLAIKKLILGKLLKKPEMRFLFIALSWYLVAFLFEPDFGSFVRHQAATFPIMIPIFFVAMEESY